MTDLSNVNLWSLGIVSGELNATIELAETSWQAFCDDSKDRTHLKATAHNLEQIHGALQLVSIRGLNLLSSELASVTQRFLEQEREISDQQREAVASGITSMARYLGYLRARGSGMPVLLIPAINDLRSVNREPRLREHELSDFSHGGQFEWPMSADSQELNLDQFARTSRRLRQMYQTGLISAIRSPVPYPHLGLMQRACERMYGMIDSTPSAERWLLISAVVGALADQSLLLTSSRRRWLSLVDREFRSMLRDTNKSAQNELDPEERDELLYLISLVETPNPLATLAAKQYDLGSCVEQPQTDDDYDFIYGAGRQIEEQRLNAVTALVKPLQEQLDSAAQQSELDKEQLNAIAEQIGGLLEELGDIGGASLASLLQARKSELEQWAQQSNEVSISSLTPLVDVLVILEGILEDAAALPHQQEAPTIENSGSRAFDAAEHAVVLECQAGLNLAKRAITAFVESGYDAEQLASLGSTLDSIRGGLHLLGLTHASTVMLRSREFIEAKQAKDLAEDPALLETLADALVSLEYYLSQLHSGSATNESILDIADESLASIGFPV